MMACSEVRAKLQLYVDHELTAPELLALEAHLLDCTECRGEHDSLRYVIDTVRGARPLYEAPAGLEDRARRLIASARAARQSWRLRVAAAAALVVVVAAILIWRQRTVADRFTTFAAETHVRYAGGLLPLDLVSSEPEVINRWLQDRVRFRLELPNYPETSDAGKPYRLHGIRLVQFRDRDAAYVAYEMAERPISLLIASAEDVMPGGGEVVRSGNLSFHFTRHKGLQTIAWTDRGLSYALVSDLQTGGARSCIVCHASAKDQRKFENLRF